MSFGVTDDTSNPFEVRVDGERLDNGNVVMNVWIFPHGSLAPITSLSFQMDPLKARALGIQLQDEAKDGRRRTS